MDTRVLAIALSVWLFGCRSDDVQIGRTGVLGAALSDYTGTWEGYGEAYQWNDGTDAFRMVLNQNGTGVIEVGRAAPLPPPELMSDYVLDGRWISMLVPGFSYPLYNARIEAQRIRLEAHFIDLDQGWCTLFTPEPFPEGIVDQFVCIKAETSDFENRRCSNANGEFDCRLAICQMLCTCDANHCQARDQGRALLDGVLTADGNEFVGTLAIYDSRVTVRLSRM